MKTIKAFLAAAVVASFLSPGLGLADQHDFLPPWAFQVNACVPEGSSVFEVEESCKATVEEIFCAAFGYEIDIVEPVVTTHCPADVVPPASSQGMKPFSPNQFCPLNCPEGFQEYNCIARGIVIVGPC